MCDLGLRKRVGVYWVVVDEMYRTLIDLLLGGRKNRGLYSLCISKILKYQR